MGEVPLYSADVALAPSAGNLTPLGSREITKGKNNAHINTKYIRLRRGSGENGFRCRVLSLGFRVECLGLFGPGA